MVSHVRGDVAQERRADDRDGAEGDADEIHVSIGVSERLLAGEDNCVIRRVGGDAGELADRRQQPDGGQLDDFGDGRLERDLRVGDVGGVEDFHGGGD